MTPFSEDPFVPPTCSLQKLNEEDAPRLASILCRMDPWATLGYTAAGLTRYLSREDPALRRCGIFARDENLCGLVAIRFPWLRGPFIELLAIFPGYQRSGLGKATVNGIAAEAAEGSKNVWATVSELNHSALQFYAELGFDIVGSLDDLIAPGRKELLLRKRM